LELAVVPAELLDDVVVVVAAAAAAAQMFQPLGIISASTVVNNRQPTAITLNSNTQLQMTSLSGQTPQLGTMQAQLQLQHHQQLQLPQQQQPSLVPPPNDKPILTLVSSRFTKLKTTFNYKVGFFFTLIINISIRL